MKKIYTVTLFLIASLLVTPGYAYCVYNNISDKYSRTIKFHDNNHAKKKVYQGNYGCELTNRREDNDQSHVKINWVSGFIAIDMYVNDVEESICEVDVHNKGGYVVVSGGLGSGFKCEVHRDPN